MGSQKRAAARRKARQRNQAGKARSGKSLSPKSQRPRGIAAIWKAIDANRITAGATAAGVVVAAVAGIVIPILTNSDHRSKNSGVVRHDAEQVTYWLAGVPRSDLPQLDIQNASDGPIRNITIFMPEPMHNGRIGVLTHLPQGFEGEKVGIEVTGGGKHGYFYYSLPDIPPCRVEKTTAFTMFSHPSAGVTALNGSIIEFTDLNGNSWARYEADSKLVPLTGYKAPAGFSWSGSTTFSPATGCS